MKKVLANDNPVVVCHARVASPARRTRRLSLLSRAGLLALALLAFSWWPARADTTLEFTRFAPQDTEQFKYVSLSNSYAVTMDAEGKIYVADTFNHRIVKLSPAGAVLATWGNQGSGSGQFNNPQGVAVDTGGNIYVTDTGNHRIVKLSPAGAVLATWGNQGSGTGQFNNPCGVVVEAGGNIYVADTNNSRIVKLSSAGAVLATWGSQGSGSGQFYNPRGMVLDTGGNIYVADTNNSRIVKLSSAGAVLASWGSPGSGSGQFNSPRGVSLDAGGNIYVADTGNHRIVKLSATGAVQNTWGSQGYGSGQFLAPCGVVVDAGGNVYVADTNNCRIVTLSPAGAVMATWGGPGSGSGQFIVPHGVAVDTGGNVYVADTGNHRIVKRSTTGAVLNTWGSQGSGSGQFQSPAGVAVDAGGNIYVADTNNHRIVKLSATGAVQNTWGSYGSGSGQFNGPKGVAVDGGGNIYVADFGNNRIVKLSAAGGVLAIWSGSNYPYGVAVDSGGNVYVADTSNSRIVKLSPAGAVLASWGGSNYPQGVAVDAGGNVYVADTYNQRITKLSPTGAILASWGRFDAVLLQYPGGVAVDAGGNVYVADTNNHCIKLGTPVTLAGTVTSPPATLTNQTSASLTLSGTGISQYKYRLDGGNWITVASAVTPISLANLANGGHTLDILVADQWGNWQVTPTTYTWTVDITPPSAAVTAPPPSITNARDMTLNVVAGDVTAYKVSIDSAAYGAETPVGTPISLTNLADRDHTIAIIGKDAAGNWQSQGSATIYTFTVDTVAPVAVLSGVPGDPTNTRTATLTVSGTGVANYQYKLDNGAWQPAVAVATPISLANLDDGQHTVSVLGIDAAGNIQSQATPTTAAWTVDTVAPVAVISGTPGTPTNSKTATLTVSGTDVAAYKATIDGGTQSAEFPAATPISLANLPDGGHTVAVVARDAAGNWQQTPTTVDWVVDTDSPTAVLSGTPLAVTKTTAATLVVSGTGVTHYKYLFDGGSYGAEFPVAQPIALTGLADGSHTMTVIGRDEAGNWQQTPTTATWIVDTNSPTAVLSGTPPNPTNAKSATLVVSGTEVIAYKVKVDSGDFGEAIDVAVPISLADLADGSHTVSVISVDAAGNWQATPTTVTWVVDTDSPTAVLAGVPDSPGNATGATIIVNGVGVCAYKYTVDGGDFGQTYPVADRITLTDLADGSHTVTVIGVDEAGNWQTTPTTAIWIVDTQAPLATITGRPDTPTNSVSASLSIGGTGVTHYRYGLEGGDYGSAIPVDTPIDLLNLADGSHTVSVIGRDAAGNWQQSPTTVTWVVDTNSPTATVSGAPPAITSTTSATLAIAGEDVTAYRFTRDGGDFGEVIPVATPITLADLSDGSHTVAIIGRDTAGNWQVTPTVLTWVVDTQAPVAALSDTPNSPTNATSAAITVGGPAVVFYRAKLDAGNYGAQTPVETKFTLTDLAEGSHTISVIGRDEAGNWQAIATTYAWIIDATPPATTLTGMPASPTNATTAMLTVGGEGVTHYKYKLNTGSWGQETPVGTAISLSNLADGDNTVSAIGRDAAGNWQNEVAPTTVSWAVDTSSPTITTFSGQPTGPTSATGATITIGDSSGTITHYKYSTNGIDWSDPIAVGFQISLSNLADGSHTLYLLVRDAAGNWQTTPTTYTWTVDSTPPTAAVTAPPPSITNARDMTLNMVAGDVTAYKVSVDGAAFGPETPVGAPINLVGLNDGDHTVVIIGRDALGNWQNEGNATVYAFTVDTTSPVAVITGLPGNPTQSTTATLSISGEGVATYQYKLDNGVYQSPVATPVAINLTGLADGSHTVSVLGIDAAGNVQSQATPTTATWTVDTTAPAAVITGTPATPTNLATAALAVSGEGMVSYKYKLDNGAYSVQPIPCGTDISLADLVDGGHVVSVIGGDAAGNWQSEAAPTTVSWVVDTTAPIAVLSGLPGSPTNSRAAAITVGGDGVNIYRYKLDANDYGPETDVATRIELSGLVDGSHTVSVKGRDLAGNWQQTPTTAAWTVDTDAPVAVLSGAPAGSTKVTAASITVSGMGIVAYRAKLDSAPFGDPTDPGTPFEVSNLADGSHTVAVIARDDAGNWQATPTTATWTVDTTAPTPVLSGVPSGTVNVATATVTVSGVTEYQYKLDNAPWNPKTAGGVPIVLTALGNGSHTLAVIGCDNLGNCQSQAAPVTATWIVDTQAPAMPTIPAAGNPARQTSSTPTLVWTSVSGAADYLVEVADNAGFIAPRVQKAVTGQARYRLASLEALNKKGMWYWRVRARDAAGNVSTWASTSFNYQSGWLPHLLFLMK